MKSNVEHNINDYLMKRTTLSSFPQIIFVETTRNCNLACPMCERARRYGARYNDSLNMQFSLLRKIAYEVFPYVQIVDYHGNGEFLSYPYFFEAIQLALQFNCEIRTVTNLNTKDSKKLQALARHCKWLCVSIDSPYESQYEALRPGASFSLLCDNLEYLSQQGRNDLCIMMTLAHDNIHTIRDMIKFIDKFGFKKLCVWNRYMSEDDPNNIVNHLSYAVTQFEEAVLYAKERNIDLRLLSWPLFNTKKYDCLSPCIKPWSSIHINYDGTIGMCDFNETPPMLSELNIERESFASIWNSPQYIKLREKHLSEEQIDFCSHSCIGKRFIDFEDLLLPSAENYVVEGEEILDVLR